MTEMPDGSNFYSTLDTSMSRDKVAKLYAAIGWEVEPCDWNTAYEVRGPGVELVIEAENPILIHGLVADVARHAEEVVAPLRRAGIAFAAEFYGPDPDQSLLGELRSESPGKAGGSPDSF